MSIQKWTRIVKCTYSDTKLSKKITTVKIWFFQKSTYRSPLDSVGRNVRDDHCRNGDGKKRVGFHDCCSAILCSLRWWCQTTTDVGLDCLTSQLRSRRTGAFNFCFDRIRTYLISSVYTKTSFSFPTGLFGLQCDYYSSSLPSACRLLWFHARRTRFSCVITPRQYK